MTYDVVVVGGGIAGLTAAQTLTQFGRKVGLFEASKRLGGRILTKETSDGFSVNLGAYSLPVQSTEPHILDPILKSQKIRTAASTLDSAKTFDAQNRPIPLDELHQSLTPEYNKAVMLIQEAKREEYQHLPSVFEVLMYHEHPTPELDSPAYWARKFITASIVQNTGAALNELSLLEIMQNDETLTENEILISPASKIVDALVKDAEATENLSLHFDSVLYKIKWIQESTTASAYKTALEPKTTSIESEEINPDVDSYFELYFKNGKKEKLQAKTVILAVPFSILKLQTIEMIPPMAPEKLRAFRHLGISHYNSVFLEFEKVFWDPKEPFIYPNAISIDEWPQYLNVSAFSGKNVPCLVIHYAGKQARFGKKTDEEIVELALQPLKRVFGKDLPALKSFHVTRFDTDPNIMGGSLYYSKTTTPEDLDALRYLDSPGLYFAGDYRHPVKHGTIFAASESGLEAALKADSFLQYKADLKREQKQKPKI